MTDPLDVLLAAGPHLAPAAFEALLARPDLAPRLAELIEDDDLWSDEEPRAWAAVHATLLLASLKPAGSLAKLLEALRKADEHEIGPIVNEMPTLLASFGPAAASALLAVADDPEEEFLVRSVVCDALTLIAVKDASLQVEVARHLRAIASDDDEDLDLRENAAISLLNFPERSDRALLVDLLGEVFDRETINLAIAGEPAFTLDTQRSLRAFYDDPEPSLKLDVETEAVGDELFDEQELPDEIEEMLDEPEAGSQELFSKPELFVVEPKAPCPCGSGKKYKNCCGKK